MSKADEMGESSAFSRAGSARSARGRAIRKVLDDDAPTQLALHLISHNPENPREELGDVTDLANSLRDHGQKQALGIMTRDAYVEANPEREDELEPQAAYVVIDGNRRLAAARQAKLSSVKVMLDDSMGKDPNEILESSLVANIHRAAFEPLDEAKALKQLLEIHGTQDALAQRLHRSQPWISQRIALLGLTPELKQALEDGEENAGLLRRVGNKPAEQQQAALDELKRKEAQRAKAKQLKEKPPEDERTQSREKVDGGKNEPTEKSKTHSETRTDPSPKPDNSTTKGAQDEERADGADHYGVMKSAPTEPAAVVMPWHNPTAVTRILREYMQPDDLRQVAKELAELI